MSTKKPLLFLMVGLLAISFALPALAATRPTYMINPEDVPGWYLYDEGEVLDDWNWSGSTAGLLEMSAWYQIWINNQSWINATAAVGLLAIDMNIDLNTAFFGFSVWDMIVSALAGIGFVEKSVTGLDGCAIWSSGGVWAAIGYHDNVMFGAVGWGSQTPPGNPFAGGLLTIPKTPSDSGAGESDILGIMNAQGAKFPGIPGFELFTVFLGVIIVTGVIFLLRKDQLSLLN